MKIKKYINHEFETLDFEEDQHFIMGKSIFMLYSKKISNYLS